MSTATPSLSDALIRSKRDALTCRYCKQSNKPLIGGACTDPVCQELAFDEQAFKF